MTIALAARRSIFFVAFVLPFIFSTFVFPQQNGSQQDVPTFKRVRGENKFVPGQIIVRFKEHRGEYERSQAHAQLGATVLRSYESVPSMQLVQIPTSASMAEALRGYRNNPDVLYAEPDFLWYPTEQTPNDPSFSQLWALKNLGLLGGTPGVDIKATAAWDLTTGSKDVVIAVIDTGIDFYHPELASRIFHGETDCSDGIDNDGNGYVDDCYGINVTGDGNGVSNPMDFIGHGTHVAGTIGAVGNNGIGISGLNWDVRILPCKFMSWNGASTSSAIQCLDYIAKFKERGVNVVASNNSWGGGQYSYALIDAIKAQLGHGILFITSAGNGGWDGFMDDNDVTPDYPAEYGLPNMITVAATDRADKLASFSNYGKRSVHVGAPGVGILSTFPGGYAVMDGTSMASPHVTGLAALIKAHDPTLDWRGIKNLIVSSGDSVSSLTQTISGKRINAYKALTCSGTDLLARTDPRNDVVTTTPGVPVLVTAVHVNCANAAGPIVATVSPGNDTFTLKDDGVAPDIAAGDGVYSANFAPTQSGTYTVTLQNADSFTVTMLRPYSAAVFAPQPYRVIAGTNLNLEDEEARELAPPFPVHFGGATFSKIFVADNGTISLGRAFTSGGNFPIPFPGLPVIIAPWWEDFAPLFPSERNVFWDVQGTAPARELIVEWRDVRLYGRSDSGSVTFQAVLFEDSDNILFNYKDVVFGTWSDWPHDNAGLASIGVQVSSVEGSQYLAYQNSAFSAGSSLLFKTTDEPDFEIKLNSAEQTAFPGTPTTYTGTVRALYGYESEVTVTCSEKPPEDCTTVKLRPSRSGTPFSITVTSQTNGEINFHIAGDGADPLHRWHSTAALLHAPDFRFSTPSPSSVSILNGKSSTISFQVESVGSFTGTVALACEGLPAGATCSFSPSPNVNPIAASPAAITLTVQLAEQTPIAAFNLRVIGTGYRIWGGPTRVQSTTINVEVLPNPDFFLAPAGSAMISDSQHSASMNLAIGARDGFSGDVNLSCSVVPAGPTCSINPAVINAAGAAVLQVSPTVKNGWAYTVTVTGTSGTLTHSVAIKYVVFDIDVQPTTDTVLYVGNYNSFPVKFTPGPNYKGKVAIACDLSAISSTTYCYSQNSTVDFSNYSGGSLELSAFVAAGTPYATYDMKVRLTDLNSGQVTVYSVPVKTVGLTWESSSELEQTVIAGETTKPFEFALTPHNGYSLKTRLALATGFEFPRSVEFTPSTVLDMTGSPIPVSATITVPKGDTPGGGTYKFVFAGEPADGNSRNSFIKFPSKTVTLHIQDFTLNFYPPNMCVAPGSSGQLSITNTEYEGLNVPVQLSCPAEMPPGISCSFDKSAIEDGESTSVTVTAAASAENGVRQLAIIGTAVKNGVEIKHAFPIAIETSHIRAELGPSQIQTVTPTTTANFYVYAGLDIPAEMGRNDATVDIVGAVAANGATLECAELPPGVTCETYGSFLLPGYGSFSLRVTDGVTPLGLNDFKINLLAFGETRSIAGKLLVVGANNIELVSPRDQDLWPGGSHTITWKYSGDPGPSVRLELYDNGQFSQIIADNVATGENGKGFYVWAIPDSTKFSSRYQVRVVSKTDPKIVGQNNGRVWIGRGVELYRPQGGNILHAGQLMWLGYTWASYALVDFDLYKGGQFVRTMIKDAPGMYLDGPDWVSEEVWDIPADLPGGNDYQVKIVPKADPSRGAFNVGGKFTIVNASLKVTSPVKGDIWRPGSRHDITWQWTGDPIPPGQDVQIAVGSETGGYGMILTYTTPIGASGSGKYSWTVPADYRANSQYKVTVSTNALSPTQGSSGAFAIGNYSQLALSIVGAGEVRTTDYMNRCTESCRLPFVEGAVVALNASSMYPATFQGWSGPCTGTGECRFTMPATDVALTATFVGSAPQDYSVWLDTTAVTVTDATPARVAVSLTPVSRFDSPINLSCTNLPATLSCNFVSSAITPGTTSATTQLTISKVRTSSSLSTSPVKRGMTLFLAMLPLAGMLWMGAIRNRSSKRCLCILCVVISSAALINCGGGGGGGGGTITPPPPPSGTYTISVVAQSGAIQHMTNLSVKVQ